MRRQRRDRRDGQEGQALVLFVIFLIMILSTLALVINGGALRRSEGEQMKALDAGALAGAASLPANPTLARTDALRFALLNHPGLSASSVSITFRCVVGDRHNDNRPDAADIPLVCNPGPSASWTCEAGRCAAVCNPFTAGRTCNTVVVGGTVATDYRLDEVTGVEGATTALESVACSGLCGADPATPLDIGIVLDRTSSMSAADLANVKNATRSLLTLFDPSLHHLGLAALGRSDGGRICPGGANARGYASSSATTGYWVIQPYPNNGSLSRDYQTAAGAVNARSQLAQSIDCLDHSSVGTNLGDPLTDMANVLVSTGRRGVSKGIILLSDGAANQPNSRSCSYAESRADVVKTRGVEVVTIGFGVVGDRCEDVDGPYRNALASTLLADMATAPTTDNGCTDAENTDGDHYYCEPRSDNLVGVFRAAARQLLQGAVKLIDLPG